jgi:hypothetical protein
LVKLIPEFDKTQFAPLVEVLNTFPLSPQMNPIPEFVKHIELSEEEEIPGICVNDTLFLGVLYKFPSDAVIQNKLSAAKTEL